MVPDITVINDQLLTVEQVAKWLGVSEAFVRQHSNGLRRPSIPCVKIGKAVRFRRKQIEQFIVSMERLAS